MRPFRLLALPLVILPLAAAAADDPVDRVLRLFVEELVELTPGKGKFPATFRMGSEDRGAPASEKPAVTVRLGAPFAVAKYEVTQELYGLVMGKSPSRWKGRRNSVEMVSWEEANAFCAKATDLLRKKKLIGAREVIRLPSEAEWEYACRAGTATRYSFGDDAKDLGAYAWFRGNSKGEDPPVGRKKPNPWGLFDVHGYVWEWCADCWSPSHEGAAADGSPRVVPGEKGRVIRGGSWADPADSARSAAREKAPLNHRSDRVGFRCVKAAAPTKEAGK
jgi:formylglycine-generating enzyme required for sulfatase activity